MALLSNFRGDLTSQCESPNTGGLSFVVSNVHCLVDRKGKDRGFLLLLYPKLGLSMCLYDNYLVILSIPSISCHPFVTPTVEGEIINVPTL